MEEEVKALKSNGTLTMLPPGKNPFGCKWIFTVKYKSMAMLKESKQDLLLKVSPSRMVEITI